MKPFFGLLCFVLLLGGCTTTVDRLGLHQDIGTFSGRDRLRLADPTQKVDQSQLPLVTATVDPVMATIQDIARQEPSPERRADLLSAVVESTNQPYGIGGRLGYNRASGGNNTGLLQSSPTVGRPTIGIIANHSKFTRLVAINGSEPIAVPAHGFVEVPGQLAGSTIMLDLYNLNGQHEDSDLLVIPEIHNDQWIYLRPNDFSSKRHADWTYKIVAN